MVVCADSEVMSIPASAWKPSWTREESLMNPQIVSGMMIQYERDLLPILAERGSRVDEAVAARRRPSERRLTRLQHAIGTRLITIGQQLQGLPITTMPGDIAAPNAPMRS
jgi:hypothetical protein